MAAFSDYLENAIINWMRGTTFPAAPANVYVALFTAAPNDAGGGTEVSGNGYARVAVSGAVGSWNAPSAGVTANTGAIVFPAASGGNWGTITHVGIFDASSAGNLLYHAALTASKVVNDGDTIEFAAGEVDLTLD